MMPPIPKRLLPHSAELITKYNSDKWGSSTDQSIVQLENVRIEPTSKMAVDSTGTMIKLSAILFYDCRNSSPKETKFALKDDIISDRTVNVQQIQFDKRLFTVAVIDALYADTSRVHHYEVGLV